MFPFHRENMEAARSTTEGSPSVVLRAPAAVQQEEETERSLGRARAGGQDLQFSGWVVRARRREDWPCPGLLPLGFETPPTPGFPPASVAYSSPSPPCHFLWLIPAHPPGDSPAAPNLGAATTPHIHSLSRVLTSCPGPAPHALPLSHWASASSLHMLFPLPVTLFPFGAQPCPLGLMMPLPILDIPEQTERVLENWHNFCDGAVCSIVCLAFIFPTRC